MEKCAHDGRTRAQRGAGGSVRETRRRLLLAPQRVSLFVLFALLRRFAGIFVKKKKKHPAAKGGGEEEVNSKSSSASLVSRKHTYVRTDVCISSGFEHDPKKRRKRRRRYHSSPPPAGQQGARGSDHPRGMPVLAEPKSREQVLVGGCWGSHWENDARHVDLKPLASGTA